MTAAGLRKGEIADRTGAQPAHLRAAHDRVKRIAPGLEAPRPQDNDH